MPTEVQGDDVDVRHELVSLIPRLRRFGQTLTGNMQDSDDLVQGAIERALKNLKQWKGGTRLDSWMFRIMQNLWIDQCRANKRCGISVPIDELYGLSSEDGRKTTENQLMVRQVEHAIAALPEEQRSLVALVLVEGLSYSEASHILDVPMGTVMSRLARARKTLVMQLLPGDE